MNSTNFISMKNTLLFFLLLALVNLALANEFTSLHDSTKAYTHPSYVLFNGEPYRTDKSVPANTPITNTEYWVNLKEEGSKQQITSGQESPPNNINTKELAEDSPGVNNTPVTPPSFTSATTTTFAENLTSTVYTALATGAASYSISGDDSSLFSINESSGILTFKDVPDYETPKDQGGDNNYSIIITAINTGGSSQITLSILVTDDTSDNPVPPAFSNASDTVTFQENGTDLVYTANASGSPAYTITGGDDASLFVINSATGIVQFKSSPDYENPSDNGNDNVYHIEITASNSAGSAQLSLSVEITDDTEDNETEARLINISTRGYVGTDNDVLIAGFVITGDTSARKKCMIAVTSGGLADNPENDFYTLKDPYLKLMDGTGSQIAFNDDWVDLSSEDKLAISSSGSPASEKEPAIVMDLAPGAYTAIVSGVNQTTGVTNVGVNDLNQDSGTGSSRLLNISTRGKVLTGDKVMIAGFVVASDDSNKELRLKLSNNGASLGDSPKDNFYSLKDPNLQLVGSVTDYNDNWSERSDDEISYLTNLGQTPSDSKESFMLKSLGSGAYTIIMRGGGEEPTGIAVVGVTIAD
jgi:hypothetical protein